MFALDVKNIVGCMMEIDTGFGVMIEIDHEEKSVHVINMETGDRSLIHGLQRSKK